MQEFLEDLRTGNTEEVEEYLKKHPKVINQRVFGSNTPLLYVIRSHEISQKRVKMIKLLLDRGADIEIADESMKYTPLLFAIYNGDYDIVQLLFERNADTHPNIKFDDDDTIDEFTMECARRNHEKAEEYNKIMKLWSSSELMKGGRGRGKTRRFHKRKRRRTAYKRLN